MAGAKKASANKKRKKTIVSRQKAVKEKVLAELEKMPIIEVAVKKAGISSSTYYRWLKEDSVFARAASHAYDCGVQYINDIAESKVITGVFNGDKTMVIFWLKNRHKKYTDKQLQVHEIVDSPLTEERKKQIAEALKNWSTPPDDSEPYIVKNP